MESIRTAIRIILVEKEKKVYFANLIISVNTLLVELLFVSSTTSMHRKFVYQETIGRVTVLLDEFRK